LIRLISSKELMLKAEIDNAYYRSKELMLKAEIDKALAQRN